MKKYYVNYDEVSEEEFYEPFKVVGITLFASTILKKCDPVVYRCCVDSYASSIMDEAKCELEKHGCYEISIERFEIEEEEEELNIIDDIDKLKNYDNNTNYIIIDCYCLVEVDEDGEYGKIEVLGYDTQSAEFTRGF